MNHKISDSDSLRNEWTLIPMKTNFMYLWAPVFRNTITLSLITPKTRCFVFPIIFRRKCVSLSISTQLTKLPNVLSTSWQPSLIILELRLLSYSRVSELKYLILTFRWEYLLYYFPYLWIRPLNGYTICTLHKNLAYCIIGV